MKKVENHIELSISEAIIISRLLEMAGEEFSNNGCNDLPDDFYDECRLVEVMDLFTDLNNFNGNAEPTHEFMSSAGQQDDAMMSLVGAMLGKISGRRQ